MMQQKLHGSVRNVHFAITEQVTFESLMSQVSTNERKVGSNYLCIVNKMCKESKNESCRFAQHEITGQERQKLAKTGKIENCVKMTTSNSQ